MTTNENAIRCTHTTRINIWIDNETVHQMRAHFKCNNAPRECHKLIKTLPCEIGCNLNKSSAYFLNWLSANTRSTNVKKIFMDNKTEKSITVPDSKISSNGETKEPTPWL